MNSQAPNATAPNAEERTPKLLDQVRSLMRLQHYSIHTERSYVDWIRRFIHFHQMQSRADLVGGEAKIEAFLTDLAVNGKVAAATQNQAMNALVFLYRRVLEMPLDEKIDAVRAERKVNVPVVMTREEVTRMVSLLDGVPQLIVKMLYGSGLRVLEAVRLRIKDVDFTMKQVTVRSGKGEKDRFTTLSASLVPLLENHLRTVKTIHEQVFASLRLCVKTGVIKTQRRQVAKSQKN
jgi:site-specific recombinase XerD